jgi:hypothetical protein
MTCFQEEDIHQLYSCCCFETCIIFLSTSLSKDKEGFFHPPSLFHSLPSDSLD